MNVLITGASSGIGKSIYETLKKKYNVIGAARRGPDIELDLTKLEEIKKLKNFLIEKNLKIDAIINSIGIAYVKPFEKLEISEIEEQIETNLKSIIYTIKLLLDLMNENSIIVNVGSVASNIGFEDWSIYSATKFALRGLSKSLRKEISKKNIRISLVMPGAVWTELWQRNNFNRSDDMLMPFDIATIIEKILELPNHINIDEITITHIKRAY